MAKVLDINYCMFIILIHESHKRDEANENNICHHALKDQRTDTLPLPRPMHNSSPPHTTQGYLQSYSSVLHLFLRSGQDAKL